MNKKMINKQKHGGLQLKNILEVFEIPLEKVCTDLSIPMTDLVAIFSKQELDLETIQRFSNYLSVPTHVITNFKDDMKFNTTILSENNTVINYNYCINQNSIDNIAKIYEVVKELVKKENEDK